MQEENKELEVTFKIEDNGHNKLEIPEYVATNGIPSKNAKMSNKDKVKVVETVDGKEVVVEKKVAKK